MGGVNTGGGFGELPPARKVYFEKDKMTMCPAGKPAIVGSKQCHECEYYQGSMVLWNYVNCMAPQEYFVKEIGKEAVELGMGENSYDDSVVAALEAVGTILTTMYRDAYNKGLDDVVKLLKGDIPSFGFLMDQIRDLRKKMDSGH